MVIQNSIGAHPCSRIAALGTLVYYPRMIRILVIYFKICDSQAIVYLLFLSNIKSTQDIDFCFRILFF